ncbi:MAG: S9 family peptidase, partial [Xanthomonadales bacterium]|nr:S9 family peptidase [Xanthomonadales bacterium]
MTIRGLALGAALLAGVGAASASEPLSLEQIMAAPEWIGTPVESAWWSLDGTQVYFNQKRSDGPVRDLMAISLADGRIQRVDDAARSTLDAPAPVYDAAHRRAVFVRNDDLFLRDLASQRLTALTRTGDVAGYPQFSADGRRVQFQRGADWYAVDLASGLIETLAQLKAAKDPNAAPKGGALRALQLELIHTLAQRRADKDALRARDEALRKTDPSRAAAPIYLGDDISLVQSALSPDGRWLLAVTQSKDDNPGQAGKMPVYVTESGYEEVEDVRTRVGRNPPAGQKLVRIDLATGNTSAVALDALAGIAIDPLAELRKAAGKDALNGARPVRVDAIKFSADGQRAAVLLRAVDNKDRWIAG